jgi:hypothetical protein
MLNHFAPYGAGSWADSLCPGTLFEGQAESAIAWALHVPHSRALKRDPKHDGSLRAIGTGSALS